MGARKCADGVGARERWKWVGEGLVGLSERGCADVCRRCRCKGKVGNGLSKVPVGMSERRCADVCTTIIIIVVVVVIIIITIMIFCVIRLCLFNPSFRLLPPDFFQATGV